MNKLIRLLSVTALLSFGSLAFASADKKTDCSACKKDTPACCKAEKKDSSAACCKAEKTDKTKQPEKK